MKKTVLLLLLAFNFLYGCATCMIMTPMTEVRMTLHGKDERINRISYAWKFSEIYSTELMFQYDANANGELDQDELKKIKMIKVEYLEPRAMLTALTYSNAGENEEKALQSSYKNFTLTYEKRQFTFTYEGFLDYTPKADSVLSFVFEDSEGFFEFGVTDINTTGLSLYAEPNTYLFTAAVIFKKAPPLLNETLTENNLSNGDEVVVVQEYEPTLLEQSIIKIKTLMEKIKEEKSSASIFLLLLFAYLYGLIHALGPGHGKTLVSSYFLGNERSLSKALFVSLAIGMVHTFSAFLLTAVVYVVLNQLLSRVMDDVLKVTTLVSAIIIIAIAIWLLYKKIKAYRVKPQYRYSASTGQSALHVKQPHLNSCACASCKVDHNSTDAALIISAGIVPCPGTVTLFIFAFSLGLYTVGVVAAFVMSLGMSTIIFVSAAASVLIRNQASRRFERLKPLLEFASLGIILLLGLLLLVL